MTAGRGLEGRGAERRAGPGRAGPPGPLAANGHACPASAGQPQLGRWNGPGADSCIPQKGEMALFRAQGLFSSLQIRFYSTYFFACLDGLMTFFLKS